MAKRVVEESNLTALANLIRQKAGLENPLVFPEDFTTALGGLQILGNPDPAVLTVNNCRSSCIYRYYINGDEAWNSGGTISSNGSLTLDMKVGSAVMLMIQTTRYLYNTSATGYNISYAMTDGIGLSYSISRSASSTMYYNHFYFAIITGTAPRIDITLS